MIEQNHSENNDIERYSKTLWWPIIIVAIFQIIALYNANQVIIIALANACLLGITIYHVNKGNHNRSWQHAATVAAFCGIAATIIVALYKLIFQFEVIYIFNLFTQPAIYGVLFAIFAAIIQQTIQLTRARRILKGGEHNGQTK